MNWIELLGMSATTFIVIGFLFKSQLKIRAFNLAGSVIFVVYGLLIAAPSVYLLNAICASINIYNVIKIKSNKFGQNY